FFSSRRRHTRFSRDWSSDVCSSDLGFVMPCLLLNYFGQGAMIIGLGDAGAAEAIQNPFFFLAPEALRLPLVLLATAATFIASQRSEERRVGKECTSRETQL